jgi:predicted phosphate transport protein (TIGR00153 family)
LKRFKILLSDVLSSEAVENLERFVELVSRASEKFSEALKLLNDIKVGEARERFTQTVRLLEESAKVRALVEEEVANTSLDPGFKEELLSLITLIDDVGDLVKEASREFTILPFLEIPVPMREGLLRLTRTVSAMINTLSGLIKALLAGDYKKVDEALGEIVRLEEEADEEELENRSLLLSLSDRLKPPAIQLLIHDLNAILENTADACTRAARRAKLLIVAWLG